MDTTQRIGVLWCAVISIVIGYFNIDYMAGWGAGNSIEAGQFTLPYSWIMGTIAVIIDVGMILSLAAMARWHREDRQLQWFLACFLFLMFTLFSGHSLWRDLQTNIGSKQETAERTESTYRAAERERDSTLSLLVTLRAELAEKPLENTAELRRQLAIIPSNQKTNASRMERQISRIETDKRERLSRLERDIKAAEGRLAVIRKTLDWSPIDKKAAPIAGFEALIAGGLMITDIVGWIAIVGVGSPSRREVEPVYPDGYPSPNKNKAEIERSNFDLPPPSREPPKLVVDNSRKKRKTVTAEIEREAVALRDMKVRVEDIARRLDVSIVTVRRILKKDAPVLGKMAGRRREAV